MPMSPDPLSSLRRESGSRTASVPVCTVLIRRCSLSRSGILGLFLELVGGLFVLLADLVEFPHVLEEVWASLERDEKLRLLAIAPVVRGLNCDGLGSDLLECGVVVPIKATHGG